MKRYPLDRIAPTHQVKLIKAKSSGIVFEIIMPKSCIGFIEQVANSWYPNTILHFIVDNETEVVKREIAPINIPKHYDPPIVVKNFIRWIAYNNSEEDHYFEVLCDGYYVKSIP